MILICAELLIVKARRFDDVLSSYDGVICFSSKQAFTYEICS